LIAFFGGQFDEEGVIEVWSVVALYSLGGAVHAVVHDLACRTALRLFSLESLQLGAESGVELENGFEVLAHVFEPGAFGEEGLVDASAG
jgi:hypothetical protein